MASLWSFGRRREPESTTSSVSLAELERGYDIVEVHDEPGQQYAVVTPKRVGRPPSEMRELGSSSPSPWTSFRRQEYNPALLGIKGLEAYDRMRKSDGTVRGTLRAIKTPVLSGRYFIKPASSSEQDIEAANWVWYNLQELMSISFTQVLTESLLMCDFGYYMFEKVWENRIVEGKMRTVLRKLAPRHPMDVKGWEYDAHGGPNRVLMYPGELTSNIDEIPIDIAKLLVFTFDREAGNIEGISVLRSAYKHWYFMEQLYKIDAIQKERHGIGIPVIKLPLGFKPEDKAAADELGRNIRTNERAHIVLPPGWDIMMLKLEGQPVNALESVQQHQAAIRENILVNFVIEGAREEDLVMFYKASRFVADIVIDTFNLYCIPDMVRKNFPLLERMPKLQVRRVGETADWRTLSFALRNMVGAGIIIPDDPLEENMREEMDLPDMDHDTSRLLATPQNPFDSNEEEIKAEGGPDPANSEPDSLGSGSSSGGATHNQNNPNYNRGPKKRARAIAAQRKQKGMLAGLPRQAPVGGKSRNAGSDRSGG
jgi:hypothetical protein